MSSSSGSVAPTTLRTAFDLLIEEQWVPCRNYHDRTRPFRAVLIQLLHRASKCQPKNKDIDAVLSAIQSDWEVDPRRSVIWSPDDVIEEDLGDECTKSLVASINQVCLELSSLATMLDGDAQGDRYRSLIACAEEDDDAVVDLDLEDTLTEDQTGDNEPATVSGELQKLWANHADMLRDWEWKGDEFIAFLTRLEKKHNDPQFAAWLDQVESHPSGAWNNYADVLSELSTSMSGEKGNRCLVDALQQLNANLRRFKFLSQKYAWYASIH